MSTPVRGGPQGPLGYAPRRTREGGAPQDGNPRSNPRAVPEWNDDGSDVGAQTPSLREALLRDGLPSGEPPATLREALSGHQDGLEDSLGNLATPGRVEPAPRVAPAPRGEPAQMRDALSALERLTTRSAQLLRETPDMPRAAREPAPDEPGIRGPGRDGVRDNGVRGNVLRDGAPRRPLAAAPLATGDDDDGALSPDGLPLIAAGAPRDLLDDGFDFVSPPVSRPRKADDRRRLPARAGSEVFAGDAALVALRSRLAGDVEDDFDPPPAKTRLTSVTRLAGVVGLAAGGALGFLWITSPHHRTAVPATSEEVALVDLKGSAAEPPRQGADTLAVPVPAPQKPVAAMASYNAGNPADRAVVTPPVTPQARAPRVVTIAPAPAPPEVIAPPPPSAPVITESAREPAPATVPPAVIVPGTAELVARATDLLSHGDVAAARLLLRRAAGHDNAQAALALAGTYDAKVLQRLGITTFNDADPAQARDWYRKAATLGSTDAQARLEQMDR